MPRSSHPLNLVVNLMLLPFGLFGLMLGGVVLVAGEGGEIWWVFAGLAAGGALMIGGAVQGIVRWRRAEREEAEQTRAMMQATLARQAHPAAPLPAPVLAHWTYAPGEWRAYAAREVAYRGGEAFWMGIGVVILGTPTLVWIEEAPWGVAFGVSLVLGAVIGVGKWLVARPQHAGNVATPGGEVVIAPNAILVNGRYQVLQDHNFRFGGARILAEERPPILELTVKWSTRSGVTNEQYRIPIPAGREDEARAVMEELNRAHGPARVG